MDNKEIHIARSWRKFDKAGFVAIYGLFERLGHYKLNFHLAIEPENIQAKVFLPLKKHLEKHGHSIRIYKQDTLKKYANSLGVPENNMERFKEWQWIYHILLYHRLYFKNNIDYILTLDDDIIFNEKDINVIESCCVNKVPFSIADQHVDGDKCMMGKLCDYFGGWVSDSYWRRPGNTFSGNSGFMGINNAIWSLFGSDEVNNLMDMFTYQEWDHKKHTEGAAYDQYRILLQEQSFLSILNRALNNNHIVLTKKDGYIIGSTIKETQQSRVEHYVSTQKYNIAYDYKVNGLYKDFMNVIRKQQT